MAKSRRAKKRSGHKSHVDEDPGPDISLLSRPSATSVKGIRDVIKAFEEGTQEVHHLLSNECEILYECRVCRSLYRSFLNFITHKRIYCKQQYTSGSPKVNHFFNDVLDEDETLIVHDESIRLTRQSNGDAPKADAEAVASTSSIKQKAAPRKNLTEILGRLTQKACSTEGLKRIVNIDGYAAMSAAAAGSETTGFNGRIPRQHLLHLESMESTDVAIRQTVTLGPDGKILSDPASANTSEDDDENASSNTNVDIDNETELVCTKCNISFSSRKTYRCHVNSVHDPSRVFFLCPICKGKFANSWSVHRHMKSIHHKTNDQLRKLRNQIQKVVRKVSAEPEISSKKSTSSRAENASTDKQQIYVKKQMELELFEKETKQCSGCSRKFDRLAAFNYHVANCAKRLTALKNVNESTALADAPFSVPNSLHNRIKIVPRNSQNSQNAAVTSATVNDSTPEIAEVKIENQPALLANLDAQERRSTDKRPEQPITKKIEIQLRRDYNKIVLGPSPIELSELIIPEIQEITDRSIQASVWSRVDYNKQASRGDNDKETVVIKEDCLMESRTCDLQIEIDEEHPVESDIPDTSTSDADSSEVISLPEDHELRVTNIVGNDVDQNKQNSSELSSNEHTLCIDYNADEMENEQLNNNLPGIKLLVQKGDNCSKTVDDGAATESTEEEVKESVVSDSNDIELNVSNSPDADSMVQDITVCKIVKPTGDEVIPPKSILEGILMNIKTECNAVKSDTSLSNSVVSNCVNTASTAYPVNKSKRKRSLVKRASIMDWNGFEEQQTAAFHNLGSECKRFKAGSEESSPPIVGQDGEHCVIDLTSEDITMSDCVADPLPRSVMTSDRTYEPLALYLNHLNNTQHLKGEETEELRSTWSTINESQLVEQAQKVETVPSFPEAVQETPNQQHMDILEPQAGYDDVELDMSGYVECTLTETANDDDYALSEPDSDKVYGDEDLPLYHAPSKADVDEDILKVIFEAEDLSQAASLRHKKGTIIMGNGTFSLGPCSDYERVVNEEESVSCKSSSIDEKTSADTESMSPLLTDELSFLVPSSSRLSSEGDPESIPSSCDLRPESIPLAEVQVESIPTGEQLPDSRSSSAMTTDSRPSSAMNTARRLSVDRSTSSSDTELRPSSAEGMLSSSMESLVPRSRPLRNKAKVKNADFIYDVSDKSASSKTSDDAHNARSKSGSKASSKQSAEDVVELVGKDITVSALMNPTVMLYKCGNDGSFLSNGPTQNSVPKPSTSAEELVISNSTSFGATRKSVRAFTKL